MLNSYDTDLNKVSLYPIRKKFKVHEVCQYAEDNPSSLRISNTPLRPDRARALMHFHQR